MAAYMEAYLSKEHGIRSRHLEDGIQTIDRNYRSRVILGIDFGQILRDIRTCAGRYRWTELLIGGRGVVDVESLPDSLPRNWADRTRL